MKCNMKLEDDFRAIWNRTDAVMLDFDGVLADSEPLFRESWNRVLAPWKHCISRENYWKYWSSLGEGLKGEILREGLVGIDVLQAETLQRKYYSDLCAEGKVPLFRHTADLLRLLSTLSEPLKRPFCIASNTPSEIVRDIIRRGGAEPPAVIGGEGLRKKPYPDIFLRAAADLGADPSKTLVFEDSWKGIAAAEAGGFKSVLVLNRYNGNLDLSAEYVIDGIGSLLELLKVMQETEERIDDESDHGN